jgi:uncharacterized membrane protein YkoI
MKTKLFVVFSVVCLVSSPISFVLAQKGSKEAALVREAKITMAQARKTALERTGGNVEFARLERGKGGKLFFEFEIHNSNKRESEVHVDAVTGDIFSVKEESGNVSSSKNAMLTNTKTSLDEAEQTALNRVKGAVVFSTVEKARGKVLYEFEIITENGQETEVHVDAETGQIESVEED